MNFGPNTCHATVQQLPLSEYKLKIVADLIRKMPVKNAIMQLSLSNKSGAYYLQKLLESCVANAENNHNLDVDRLIVEHVFVGKAMMLKRFMPRGRGRSTRIEKRYSKSTIVLKQKDVGEFVVNKSKK